LQGRYGFLIDVDDYIEFIETVSDRFVNFAEYQFKGVELTAENRYLENLLLRAGYTYVYTKDKSPNTERDELQYRPKHTVTFESKYSFNFGLSAYMNVIVCGRPGFLFKDNPCRKEKLE